MSILQIKDLNKTYGVKTILKDISLSINEGEKIGMVGLNGQGKTTLFNIIVGSEEYDSGEIVKKSDVKIRILKQDPQLPLKLTAIEYLKESLSDIIDIHLALKKIEEELTHNPKDFEKLLEAQQNYHLKLDQLNGWEYSHKIENVLNRLGIVDSDQIIETMSTGQKKRLALAKILIDEPDFLLLDEPTNHLDTESISWLEAWIKQFKGTCLFVTHDRYFLDRLTDKIIEVNDQKIFISIGNYGDYLSNREIKISEAKKQKDKLSKILEAEIKYLKKGVKARGTKAQYRFNKADQLKEAVEQIIIPKDISLQFGSTSFNQNRMLEVVNLSGGYSKPLFENLEFNLEVGQIIGVIGSNGSGKSTLLKTIDGELKPLSGKILKGKNVKIGVFSQNFEHFKLDETVLKNVNDGLEYYEQSGKKFRTDALLEGLLFSAADIRKNVSTLSGGEKARLTLAKLICNGANLLLFDEPTNNLDLPTLQILESFLTEFNGASIVISHDRFFLEKIADQLIVFQKDRTFLFKGSYEMFLEHKDSITQQRVESNLDSEKMGKQKSQNKVNNKLRQEFASLETEIENLETEQSNLETELSQEAVWSQPTLASVKNKRLNEIQTRLAEALNRWEEIADLF